MPRLSLLPLFCSLLLFSCAPSPDLTEVRIPPTRSFLTTFDGKRLSLHHWNHQSNPKTIIIALHGIGGAASDFRNLGRALPGQSPETVLYALNLRANGYDPNGCSRGDIADPNFWLADLRTLHQSLARRHPNSEIVWLGESMGSLIALNAAAEGEVTPDALVLASPVISLDAIPRYQQQFLRWVTRLAPCYRLSLAALAHGEVKATTDSDHFEQAEKNIYDIEKFTLRFLVALADLAEQMKEQAEATSCPVLLLHGSKDFLSTSSEISTFAGHFPKQPQVYEFSRSHHLLFFDHQREYVISNMLDWIHKSL